jgi:hypothetical protein
MDTVIKEIIWKQFGASIDMFKNALQQCPEEYLQTNRRFFYTAYHCLLFLDYYLTVPPDSFSTPLPFTITTTADIPAAALDDVVPNSIYSKKELLDYLQATREKCRMLIAGLTIEKMNERWIAQPDELAAACTMHYTVLDILLYNMRHVQHHAAQLNLLLRQGLNTAPAWVAAAEDSLG